MRHYETLCDAERILTETLIIYNSGSLHYTMRVCMCVHAYRGYKCAYA